MQVVLATLAVLATLLIAPALAAAAPAITVTSPLEGSYTADSTPSFAGATDDTLDPVTLSIHAGNAGGAIVQEPLALHSALSETWEANAESSLPDGQYTAVVEQTSGLLETGSATVTFTVDTKAPAVSLSALPVSTNDSTPTLTGAGGAAAGDQATVRLTICDGSSVGGTLVEATSTPVSGGEWSHTVAALPDGTYTAQAVQEDEAGNLGKSSAVTFVVDTLAPALTIEPAAARTKSPTPTFTGAAGALAGDATTVQATIHEGGSIAGEVVGSSSSVSVQSAIWSFTTTTLPDGTYTLQITQVDQAGNLAEVTASFTVDTTAPNVSINEPETPTNNPAPTLSGVAGMLLGDDSTVSITIEEVKSKVIEADGKSLDVSSGQWSYTTPLADGTYKAWIVQEDDVGNLGESSAVTFTIETHAPAVSIEAMAPSRDATPTLKGNLDTKPNDEKAKLTIYAGSSVEDTVVEETPIVPESGEHWSHMTAHLLDGTYTARITQKDAAKDLGAAATIFVIDTKAPSLTLASPANDAVLEVARPTFGGTAGTDSGDHASVGVRIYPGTSSSGSPSQTLTVAVDGSSWTTGSGGPSLSNGIYTVVAEQVDEAGNSSLSTATFAVAVPALPPPSLPSAPAASFQWFPAIPHVGEEVSLVSTSTDADSTITSFSWALAPGAPFAAGEHVLTTSFPSAGTRMVRLHVTDANGLAAEVAEPLTVVARRLTLMQPFPVVRIAGSAKSSSIRITLFTVQAPAGATVAIACHGRGCPSKPQRFVLASKAKSKGATVLISFGRFERSLGAGAVLEIRVSKPGQIGKYTRFTVRRGKLPARIDSCLAPTGKKPMVCPS